jgi:hypothetical protein
MPFTTFTTLGEEVDKKGGKGRGRSGRKTREVIFRDTKFKESIASQEAQNIKKHCSEVEF